MRTLIDTPAGRVPLSSLSSIEEPDGPDQIGRENAWRGIVFYANTDGSDMGRVVGDICRLIPTRNLRGDTFVSLGGQFQAQAPEQAT